MSRHRVSACSLSGVSARAVARRLSGAWRRRLFTASELAALARDAGAGDLRPSGPGMDVYTDGVHLMCSDLDRLHSFARRIGLAARLFSDHPAHPHYDLPDLASRDRAIAEGARAVSSRTLLRLFPSGRLPGTRAFLFTRRRPE